MNIQSNNTSIATHVFAETSKTIRTVTLGDDIMFIAKDVAEALGYKDTKKAIAAHCRKAITIDLRDVGNEANHPPIISAGNPNAKAIPESDVYRLIMRSKWSMKRPRKSLINNKSGETRCWHQLIRLTIGRHTLRPLTVSLTASPLQ